MQKVPLQRKVEAGGVGAGLGGNSLAQKLGLGKRVGGACNGCIVGRGVPSMGKVMFSPKETR